ncbi:MAG: DNA polymerase III subunit delta' [Lachnospiraceae bacterium]|nr:DNA polymerase III subunit delta' [Lachnospiraceae bacterium]
MAGFDRIIGHEQTVMQLKASLREGRVSHACIIEGNPGSGRRTLALAYAAALECEVLTDDSCTECTSCRQAASHNHPDIIWITHEKPSVISVDEVRTQLVGDIQIKPYSGKYKIYIMPEAEKMNQAAQNALLKTLEEPPAYAVILLLTANASSLLETIRSRCVHYQLRPLEDELVRKTVMQRMEVPDYHAALCAAFGQGSIGKALQLAGSENFVQLRDMALRIVAKAPTMSIAALAAEVKEVTEYKVTIHDFLDILSIWYRDVLYFKATRQTDRLIMPDQIPMIRRAASKCSYEGVEMILEALDKAKARLDANVSFDLTMELLFMTIREYSEK